MSDNNEIPLSHDTPIEGSGVIFSAGEWRFGTYSLDFAVAVNTAYSLPHNLHTRRCRVTVWWRAASGDTTEWLVGSWWAEGGSGDAGFYWADSLAGGCEVKYVDNDNLTIQTAEDAVFVHASDTYKATNAHETSGYYHVRVKPAERP